jgi:CMP-N,N'-diacetyllegionaminic acid synthase
MRVLGLIPARGGSKGVPRKNISPLCGRPLLEYTAQSALAARRLSRVILSTDDHEIAELGESLGIVVPFMRPKELADDASPTLPVVLHALDFMQSGGESFDAVCILQPTSPLRRSLDIDNCIELMEETGADSVVSVLPVPKTYNPHWVYLKDNDGKIALSTGDKEPIPRRQDLPLTFHRDGSVYVTRVTTLKSEQSLYGKSIFGYEIPSEFSSNLDTHEDWRALEIKLCGRTVGGPGGATKSAKTQ